MPKGRIGGRRYKSPGMNGAIFHIVQESAAEKALNDKKFARLKKQANALGFSLDDNLRDQHYEGVEDSIYGVQSVLRLFPEARPYLSGMTLKATSMDAGAYAFASPSEMSVNLNDMYYKDYQSVRNLMAADVEDRFHPIGSTAQSVSVHETGHVMTYALARKFNTSKNIISQVLVTDAMNSKVVQNYMRNNGLRSGGMRRSISGYADIYSGGRVNYNETVAEAVSDYISNGSKANVLSRAIIREMKKQFK